MEKFNQYTYGRKVNVVSDHKPLECILKKALANAPKRLQGMMMRLQKYDVDTFGRVYGIRAFVESFDDGTFRPVLAAQFEWL